MGNETSCLKNSFVMLNGVPPTVVDQLHNLDLLKLNINQILSRLILLVFGINVRLGKKRNVSSKKCQFK